MTHTAAYPKSSIQALKDFAQQVRRDILRMTHGAQSGHPGGSLGCADIVVALYREIMNYNPKNFTMDGHGEDVFILSNGHISPLWYSVLARCGYFDVSELSTFRKLDSRLQGHPATQEGLPGIRVATGSLGQGLSVGVGIAQSKKLNSDPNLVYVLMGDGEVQEGQIWEAAMYCGARGIDNIVGIMDFNRKQIDGPTDVVLHPGNMKGKWEAFGWDTLEMRGNEMDEVLDSLSYAKSRTGKKKPIMILANTEMGFGVDFMMGTHKWHGVAPNDEQLDKALSQLKETLGDY
ncbi:MAG: transketolase [Bacteroidales bacterium]